MYRQIDPGLAMDGRFGNVLTHRIRIGIGLVNWSGIAGLVMDLQTGPRLAGECGVVVA